MAGSEGLMSVDYEVSGRVQGVFFRKYTQVRCGVVGRGPRDSWAGPSRASWCGVGFVSVALPAVGSCSGPEPSHAFVLSPQSEAKRLGLVGWVRNTSHGTVQGQAQGPAARVRELQEWLRKIGSPQSRISRAEFTNEKEIAALEHTDFQIRK